MAVLGEPLPLHLLAVAQEVPHRDAVIDPPVDLAGAAAVSVLAA